MKMYDVLEIHALYNKIKSDKLPIRTLYKLHKLFTDCEKEHDFYQKEFYGILHEFGEKDEHGNFTYVGPGENSVKIKKGQEAICQKKFNDLLNLEVTAPSIEFTFDDFADVAMTLEELRPLFQFIKE